VGFRDDKLADRARIEALETEVRALRADRDAHHTLEPLPDRRSTPSRVFLVMGVVLVFAAFGIDLAAQPPPWDIVAMITMQLALLSLSVGAGLSFFVRARPGEAIVLSGRSRQGPDGKPKTQRTLLPGSRALRFPFIEQLAVLELRMIPISVELSDSVGVRMRGSVRVGTQEPLLSRATERFLDSSATEIAREAATMIENAARATLEQESLPPGAALDDALCAAATVALEPLGLQLEQLHATAG